MINRGMLYIVATPIGNLNDMTFRGVETLSKVDVIACEDTRETIKLCNHFDIKNKLISLHEHNENSKVEVLKKMLDENKNIAMVVDQGTPLISDPGYKVIKKLAEENYNITSVPGACALINALVLSAIDAREFIFVGFLPTEQKIIKKKLTALKNETRTMIFYISPHKLLKNIDLLIEYFSPTRKVALCREMTKKFEEVNRVSLIELKDMYEKRDIKGEFVLVIEGCNDEKSDNNNAVDINEVLDLYKEKISNGENDKLIIKQLSKEYNINKKELYKIIKVKEHNYGQRNKIK